ncbi:hypothetical protein [Bradyrhizobium sp. USDA 4504]
MNLQASKISTAKACNLNRHFNRKIDSRSMAWKIFTADKFWTRKKFRGAAALRREFNLTRIPIETKESIRWLENLKQSTELFEKPSQCIHIGDREADIYELFCAAQEVGTHFLVRTCVNRLAGDGDHTVATIMDEVVVKGLPGSKSRIARAIQTRLFLKSGIVKSVFCYR